MKKFIIIFLLIVLVQPKLLSQELSIGVKPSFLILDSKFVGDLSLLPPLEMNPKFSYGIGATISEQIRRFSIKAEPRFILKGYNMKFSQGVFTTYRNNYISLPILFAFAPFKKFNLEVGPDFSYLISSKVKDSGWDSFRKNMSTGIKSFEFSVIGGVSYSLLNSSDLGIRYSISLTPFVEDKLSEYYSFISYKIIQRYFEFYITTKIFTNHKNKIATRN